MTEYDDKEDLAEKAKDDKELIALVRKRYKFMYEADHENRQAAMIDLKFVNEPGYQWDKNNSA